MGKLTTKQQLFVAAYSGNATEAAIKAGYSPKTARQLGAQLLSNINIQKHLQAKTAKKVKKLIATREERQQFWTDIMRNKKATLSDRMKASDLLGRSEADFTDKTLGEHNFNVKMMPKIKITRVEEDG